MFSSQKTKVNHDDMLALINAKDILSMAQNEFDSFLEKQLETNPESKVIDDILDLSFRLDSLERMASLLVQHAILMNDYLRECNHD